MGEVFLIMLEDPETLHRRATWIDGVRATARTERKAGFVACLAGALLLLYARFTPGAPAVLLWLALAVIAAGWALFAWSIWRRFAYLRAHPFEDR